MSRWAKLFAELSKGVTPHDSLRHQEAGSSQLSSSVIRCRDYADTRLAVATARQTVAFVFLDFETRNLGGCDLKTAGSWRYAADSRTEVLTLIYQIHDTSRHLWTPGRGKCDPLTSLAENSETFFACFAQFEQAVWESIMVARYGFARIPIERWVDQQAVASYYALPRSLDKVLKVIGSPVVKDAAGARLVRSLSKPDRKTGAYPELTPEVLERVRAYNEIDVAGLVTLHEKLGELPEQERATWELDQRINQRGLQIDVELVRTAKAISERSTGALIKEFAELTAGLSPYQIAKTREWLSSHGYSLPNLQEDTVREALDSLTLLPPTRMRRVLEIRAITASTALKKLDAMLACVGSDGRARGLLQYHAATPGRWSGQLFQPQNLPRPTVEIDDAEEVVTAVKTGDLEALHRWGDPLEVLASALRFSIVAKEGSVFGVGDFSAIECCVLLALAGQHDKCELLASGIDVYRDMAATIYSLDRETYLAIPEDELTLEQSEQRRIGKNTVLGCGYSMGGPRFRNQYLRHLPKDEAEKLATAIVYSHYRKDWAPRVPNLWRDLEHAARRAMLNPGVAVKAKCGITYQLETIADLPILVCRLLNGKRIHYADARVSADKLDRFGNPVWTYWAYRRGQWREIEPYGGQLAENVVQALARELLAAALHRFEARGYPVVMHCHDEIVVEHPEITEAIVKEIMTERPEWAEKLAVPVAVKAWVGRQYRK